MFNEMVYDVLYNTKDDENTLTIHFNSNLSGDYLVEDTNKEVLLDINNITMEGGFLVVLDKDKNVKAYSLTDIKKFRLER